MSSSCLFSPPQYRGVGVLESAYVGPECRLRRGPPTPHHSMNQRSITDPFIDLRTGIITSISLDSIDHAAEN